MKYVKLRLFTQTIDSALEKWKKGNENESIKYWQRLFVDAWNMLQLALIGLLILSIYI